MKLVVSKTKLMFLAIFAMLSCNSHKTSFTSSEEYVSGLDFINVDFIVKNENVRNGTDCEGGDQGPDSGMGKDA